MLFADALTLDAPRRTQDGYLAVHAKAARVGAYQYSGREVDPENAHGLRDQAVVNVLRDADHVFSKRSLGSFVGKPITDDHPLAAVNARNWRDHARGVIMGAAKDGEHVGFDLAFLDGETVDKVDAGKVELSNGYSCTLEFGDFLAADGTKCVARQTNITGNHIALVDRGRAGPECRVIRDAAHCDSAPQSFLDSLKPQEKPVPKIILVDGLSVDVSNPDVAESTIKTVSAQRDAATAKVAGLETKAVTDAATIVAKDAEIVKLTADLAAAKPTLQQLRDAGKAFAVIEGKAKAAGITVTDAMDESAIMKAVVDKMMPGNTYAGDHIGIAFDALTKDLKVAAVSALDAAISGMPVNIGDARTDYEASREKRKASLSDAWKTPSTAAAA